MSQRVHIGKISELEDNEIEAFPAEGRLIAVARIGDRFYAIDDRCTHKECSLSEGLLEEETVICPCHGSEFDLATGEPRALPAKEAVERFDVIVDGEDVYVKI